MINMMYLVLTALLALNVSSEILNAFKTVNSSLETTNATVNKSTEQILASLKDKMTDPSKAEKAKIWYPKAEQVQTLSKSIVQRIQELKDRILVEAGGKPGTDQKFKEDNLDIATRIMVEKGEGPKLLALLTEYRKNLLAIDPSIDSAFKTVLPINLEKPKSKNKAGKTWEGAYFHMVPTVAALTILTKFQNDVKTSENTVVQFCHNKVGEVVVRFDTYAAIVGQNSNYLMPGQDLEITAGVGAFSKAAMPTVTINGQTYPIGTEGTAMAKMSGGGIGNHTVPVRITYTDQDGKPQVIEKNIEYKVGQANASIALDKMNVLYIGVDNPVSIAASGGGDDKVNATMSQGSLTRVGQGKWVAKVNKVDDNTTITVSVEGKVAGVSTFRVRTVPDAQAYVGGNASGSEVPAGAFKAQPGVAAGIKNFPFDLKYEVVSYTFTCDDDNGDIVSIPMTGALFQGQVKRAIDQNVKAGRMVTLENIRVKGPDGRITPTPSLFYYIR
jgi:gliding motility-associated protein GldM